MSRVCENPDVYFWFNAPNPHQIPIVNEFARIWQGRVHLIVDDPFDDSRPGYGAITVDGSVDTLLSPSNEVRHKTVVQSPRNAIHVLSGFVTYPGVRRTLGYLILKRRNFYVYSESWDPRGIKGPLRKIKYAIVMSLLSRRLAGFLPIGNLARQQVRSMGPRDSRVFPYAYATAESDLSQQPRRKVTPQLVRFVYVGQLIRLKRVDLLIQSLARFDPKTFEVEIIGEGPEAAALQELVRLTYATMSVNWYGRLSNADVLEHLENADVLVLPSDYDGWGAVINEALTAGCRVVASSACGASQVLPAFRNCGIFDAGSVLGLSLELEKQLRLGRQSEEDRESGRCRAQSTISPAVVAAYLASVLAPGDGSTRTPPWATIGD